MAQDLEKAITDVPFTGGLSTKVDPFQIPFNKLAAAQDVVFTSPGQIQTRFGYEKLPNRTFGVDRFGNTQERIEVGQAVFNYGAELNQCDPLSLFAWNSQTQQWVPKGALVSIPATSEAVTDDNYQQQAADEALSNGIRLTAWEDGQGGSYYTIRDVVNGTTLTNPTLIHARACKPRVVAVDGRIVVIYLRSDTMRLYMAVIPSAAPFATFTGTAFTSASTAANQINAVLPNYDACAMDTTAGPVLYVAFNNNVSAGSAGITTFGYRAAAGALSDPTSPTYSVTTASLTPGALTIFPDSLSSILNGPVILFNRPGTDVRIIAYRYDLTTTTFGSTLVQALIGTVTALSGVSIGVRVDFAITRKLDLYWTFEDPDPWESRIYTALASGATPTVTTAVVLRYGVALAGKAFALFTNDDRAVSYVPAVHVSADPSDQFYGLQDTYFVIENSRTVVCSFFPGEAGGFPAAAGIGASPLSPYGDAMLPQTYASSATTFHVALLQADFLTTVGEVGEPATDATFSRTTPAPGTQAPLLAMFTEDGVRSVTFDFFNSQTSYLRADLAAVKLIGGGFLQQYDGQRVSEVGFHLYPENITLSQSNTSGGSLTLLATYWYTFVYQWVNAQGRLEQSSPSVPIPITLTGSNDTVTAVIPTYTLTSKPGVTILAFRSLATGTVFQQCIDTTTPADSGATNAPILNTTTDTKVTFIDKLADVDINGNPVLYTTGNVVENGAIGPVSDLAVNYNRVFVLSSIIPNRVYFSQQALPGEAVQLSPWFYFDLDPRGGNTTAIRAMDQHLIAFKESLIMAVDGVGPDATGGQGNFGEAYIVTTDVGCIYPRSIGMGPYGLYFESEKGIYLLDRTLAVHPVGSDAQRLISGKEVTSCNLMPDTQQMRFTTDAGYLVGHDYFVDQWFQHTGIAAVDGAIWQARFAYLRSDGFVMVERQPSADMTIEESLNTYSDGGVFVGMSIESPWFDFGGLSGWVRTWWAYLLSKVYNRARLRVQFAYDQNPAPQQTIYIEVSPGAVYGDGTYGDGTYGGIFPNSSYRMQPNQQLANSVKLTVTVLQVNGVIGPSVALSGFSFEYGRATTARKPNSSATYG